MTWLLLKILRMKWFWPVFWVQRKTQNREYLLDEKKPQNARHQRACDVSPQSPKPSALLLLTSGIHTIADAYHALFPDEMGQLIISNTNAKIQHIKDNLPWYYNRSDKNPFIRHLDERELYTYIGLHYARSILGQSMQSYKMLFSETSGHPVFSTTMSKHRFYFLYTVLSFDDPEKRCGLSRSHRFAVAHELTFIFNNRMKSVLVPSGYLAINETLYAMRHHINFRQYNPNKPAKYRLLYKFLNGARFPFIYQVMAYCRKPVGGTGSYYLNATESYVKHLVQSMPVSFLKGKNISMDLFYKSIST